MNYFQMPYESDYSEDGNKLGGMTQSGGQTQRGSSMPMLTMPGPGTGMNMNMNQMQLPMGNMSQMGQMPMSTMSPMTYPMQGNVMQAQPMPMMQPMHQGQGQMSMSPISMPTMSQLPPGAVTPLSSMTMMPVMGGIDGSGMNVVVPDLQPLSAMSQMSPGHQMSQMPQMSQMSQMPQMQHHQQQQQNSGRLSGGTSAGNSSSWMNYGSVANNGSQMMPSSAWSYPQSYPSTQSFQGMPQQQQQQQPQQRMKSQYDYATNNSDFREARNGLNSPTMDSMRFSRSDGKKAQHWR